MSRSNNPTSAAAVIGQALPARLRVERRNEVLRSLLMPAIMIALATYMLIGILTMHVPVAPVFPGPEFFPSIIAGGLYLFAALSIIGSVRAHRQAERRLADADLEALLAEEPAESAGRIDLRAVIWIVVSFLLFALTLTFVGWIIGAGLLFWAITRAFRAERPVFGLVVGVTVSALTYIAFDMMLGMTLPSGILGGGF